MQFPPVGYEICLWVISGYEPAEGQNRGIRALFPAWKNFSTIFLFLRLPLRKLIPPDIDLDFFGPTSCVLFPRFGSISMEIDRIRMQFLDSEKFDDEYSSSRLSLKELFSYFRRTYRTVFYIFTSILFYMYIYIIFDIVSKTLLCRILFKYDL